MTHISCDVKKIACPEQMLPTPLRVNIIHDDVAGPGIIASHCAPQKRLLHCTGYGKQTDGTPPMQSSFTLS